ncbi:MAG: outer membrane beta-barrel protein [Gammaproteobacteria bacterium]
MLLAIAAALALPAGTAQAQELIFVDARPARFFIGAGLTAGGDRLVTARFVRGDDYTIHGGALLQIYGGYEFRVAPALTLALSVGYHVDSADAWNGSTWFSRIPVEALAHYRVAPNWRIGGGVRFALHPRLQSDGYAPDVDEDFKAAIGPVIEVEYLFNPSFGLKLRGVSERYRSKAGLPTVNGDHLGLFASFYF